MKIEEEKSPARGRIRTHNLMIMRRVLYHCATTSALIFEQAESFQSGDFFPGIAATFKMWTDGKKFNKVGFALRGIFGRLRNSSVDIGNRNFFPIKMPALKFWSAARYGASSSLLPDTELTLVRLPLDQLSFKSSKTHPLTRCGFRLCLWIVIESLGTTTRRLLGREAMA